MQQRSASQNTDNHQDCAEDCAEQAGGCHGAFELSVVPCAIQLGDNDRTAHVAAKGKGDKDKGDIVTVSNGSQCIFTDKFTGDKTVCDIVELLEEDASKHGKAEFPQYGLRITNGQVFVHINDPILSV